MLGDISHHPTSCLKSLTHATRVAGCGPWRPGGARTLTLTSEKVEIQKIIQPIPTPPAIIGVGLNYTKHAVETGKDIPLYPILFMKNPSTVIGPGEDIVLPNVAKSETDYECEMAVIIGARPVKNVSRFSFLAVGFLGGDR